MHSRTLASGLWGHGIPTGQLSIGNAFFSLPLQEKEKRKHPCNFDVGAWAMCLAECHFIECRAQLFQIL
ncbi:hypothetical protein B0H16DRAFT_1744438 [Mycena metata]|uniref:Uncharacterized protein n=1 Tax=Mycena metata TaxID=1033252 RepID=A0AAD7MDL1_9AGAR|nr:hypothetical protein B0H16DRAFT_1744438 [Mycena metata]